MFRRQKNKWKRKVKRVKNNAIFSRSQNTSRHKKDFSWKNRNRNPLIAKEKISNTKIKIQIFLIVVAIISMLWLSIYHSFFHITKINIVGLQRISEEEITTSIRSVINYKKLFIFPGKNYFLVDVDEINAILKEKYPINSIIVKKSFPHSLSLIIGEKISTLIYDNGNKYGYIGLEGKIVEVIRTVGEDEWVHKTTTTIITNEDGEKIEEEKIIESTHKPPLNRIITEMGDFPIVYDKRGREVVQNAVALKQDTVSGIIKWFNLINNRTDIPFGYVIINNELGDGFIKTKEGWEIKTKLNIDVEKQFESLEFILKEKVNRPNLSYVDLRFGSQVYWK